MGPLVSSSVVVTWLIRFSTYLLWFSSDVVSELGMILGAFLSFSRFSMNLSTKLFAITILNEIKGRATVGLFFG